MLQALKILARRQDIRQRCTQQVLGVLAPLLDASAGSSSPSLASEAANAASNLAYEAANAAGLVRAGAVPRLLNLLGASAAGSSVHANAAGALQTLSFSPEGRAAVIQAGGAAAVLKRLASSTSLGDTSAASVTVEVPASSSRSSSPSESGKSGGAAGEAVQGLVQRLVGTLHNLSSRAAGITAIRTEGGIAPLCTALRCGLGGVAASAAGALQNMSREAAARADIRGQPGALAALASLLAGPDVQVGRHGTFARQMGDLARRDGCRTGRPACMLEC